VNAIAGRPAPSEGSLSALCRHCGQPAPAGREFCCHGCEAAYDTIQQMGLGQYYQTRTLDPTQRAPRPDVEERLDLAAFAHARKDGGTELELTIDGIQCGACVWLIEQVLGREPSVIEGRVNLTSGRLRLAWRGDMAEGARLVSEVERLGYRLVPYRAEQAQAELDRVQRELIRCLGVAGFAAGNVMLLSIGIWFGLSQGMGPATRDLMHWVSALIALPAVAYAGRPFFHSAWSALRHGRTNMDVPISLGVILVSGMSLVETMRGGEHAYFDSACALLFFLLIGRALDHRARGQARATAERLLALRGAEVSVRLPDGTIERRAPERVAPGSEIVVGMGERIGVDGALIEGETTLDTSLVTGESLPEPASLGKQVFAGMVNLGAPIVVRATATGGDTLLAEMARLIDSAESRRGRFVVLADRVARRYAPVVHIAALATFLAWHFIGGMAAGPALLIACSVLIVTCPCALALAVPAAQVIASGELMRRGTLLKSPTALERLGRVDTVVFDKTGTLSAPELALRDVADPAALKIAASLAAHSRHPLARALCAAAGPVAAASFVVEHPGQGLSAAVDGGEIRLGSESFCGVPAAADGLPGMVLARPGEPAVRFAFAETMRPDAAQTVAALKRQGMTVILASGDRDLPVSRAAAALGIEEWHARCCPAEKMALVEQLRAQGRRVLMVGDGLNDGPCLAAADVSMSPASAADISQNVADLVFQGRNLAPVAAALTLARRTERAMRQNLGLALAYNLLAAPAAMAGCVTPWLAAAAMSSSSLLVMANSLRLRAGARA
jgi:P-type Cu2+ transporter